MDRRIKLTRMSYVSLENSDSFLKCFEVIAEDKSSIVSDSVLYYSGKTGKGFITVAGIATGIEVLAVNLSMLTEELTFHFQSSANSASYILSFDEIETPGKSEGELALTGVIVPEQLRSSVSIADAAMGRTITYPKDRIIRSIIVRVRQSALDQLIRDFDAGTISRILEAKGGGSELSWPIT